MRERADEANERLRQELDGERAWGPGRDDQDTIMEPTIFMFVLSSILTFNYIDTSSSLKRGRAGSENRSWSFHPLLQAVSAPALSHSAHVNLKPSA